jgi:two-component system, LytTR family, sensor kinase
MTRSPVLRQFWTAQFVIWPLYAAIHYVAALPAVAPEDRWPLAGVTALRTVIGLGVSMPLPFICRRMLIGEWRLPIMATGVAVSAYVLSAVWMMLDRLSLTALITGSLTPMSIRWSGFPWGVDLDYTLVLLASGAVYVSLWHGDNAARHRREALEQAVAAHDARLQALTYQLSPHFLLNSLSSLRGVIAEDATKARDMVTALARFVRITLSAGELLTLGDEIDLTNAYLAIERIRFERALSIEIDVDADVRPCLVPALLLQPLVENAITHGTADAAGTRHLRLFARRTTTGVAIEIANPGRLTTDVTDAPGVGARNARERLAHVYGQRQQMTFRDDDGWVRVSIVIDGPRYAS